MNILRPLRWLPSAIATMLLAACVTINVYFPAAAAEKAAEEFVGKVIGDDAAAPAPREPQAPAPAPDKRPLSLIGLIISDVVAAEPDLTIATPAIKGLQQRMAERFKATLASHFDTGALGFTKNGMVELRDAAAVPLAARATLKQAVADDNRDRDAVYREIALANGHADWEAEIRATFAKQWIAAAHAGWYYQDAEGQWRRK